MAFDFILMLTENDRTIADARARLDEALEGGVRHIGFKDVGLPLPELRALATAIRDAGGRSYLEVVSLDAESEMASARAAVDLDVDVLLGGTRAEDVTAITRHHPIRYYPFPGRITGHPSVLEGPEAAISWPPHARLRRWNMCTGSTCWPTGIPETCPQLMASVSAAVAKPVIVAGSIDSAERVEAAATSGAQGFTVGTAALAGAFRAESDGFAGQVRAIMAITARAQAMSTAPRRIALVAHDTRKTHLSAWVTRHAGQLARHRIVCTGGTGRVLARTTPELSIDRLQRGGRGGDQQLAAMIATGGLDAVVFFADPTVPHSGDVDLQALTRLTVIHDIPLALGPSSAGSSGGGIAGVRGVLTARLWASLPRSPQIVSEITAKTFPTRRNSAANRGHCQCHGNGGLSLPRSPYQPSLTGLGSHHSPDATPFFCTAPPGARPSLGSM
jgi:methylglyoxal synthase